MFAALGHRVINLKRVRMGNIRLGDIEEGQTRPLGPHEISSLKQTLAV